MTKGHKLLGIIISVAIMIAMLPATVLANSTGYSYSLTVTDSWSPSDLTEGSIQSAELTANYTSTGIYEATTTVYNWYLCEADGTVKEEVTDGDTWDATYTIPSDLLPGTYYYKCTAKEVNSAGNELIEATSDPFQVIVKQLAPVNPSITLDTSPNTGDNFALIGIIAVMVIAAAGVIIALVRRRS